ncbi:MAG: tripartite tricarboxylate transporter TctB family protein [Geminicoccaceae bacterium]
MWRRLWQRSVRRADLILALGVIGFATLLYVEALKVPPPFFDPLGSAAVPKFVAVILIVLALIVAFPFSRPREEASEPEQPVRSGSPITALGSVAVAVAYVGSMQAGILSFAQSSCLFIVALGAMLARGRPMMLAVLVPAALIVGFGLNHLFTQVLFIDLPQASIFDAGPDDG